MKLISIWMISRINRTVNYEVWHFQGLFFSAIVRYSISKDKFSAQTVPYEVRIDVG